MKEAEVPPMIYDVEDLNDDVGKNVYLLVIDDILLGSTRKSDINDYLAGDKALLSPDNYEEGNTLLLYGLVLDIRELPYELPKELKDNEIWIFQRNQETVLMGMVTYRTVPNMKEATKIIEQSIAAEDIEVDDFAIVIGSEIELIIQIGPGTFKIDARYVF